MKSVIPSIAALLLGVALLLLGSGLQGTLLGIRGAIEGFSPASIGFIMSAYYVGFAAGCMFAARVIERVGHIRAFAAFASLASAAAVVFPVSPDPVFWVVLRMLTGYCFAGLYMAIESWLNGRVANENRGRMMAIYMVVNLGAIAAAQQLLNLADPAGFILFVLSSVLVSVALVPVALTTSVAPSAVPTDRMSLADIYGISPLGTVGAFAIGLANGAMWGLIPLAGIQTGMSTSEISVFMTVIVLGGVALQWPIGRLSDLVDRRHVIIISAAVLAGASVTVFFAAGADWWIMLAVGLVLGGMNLVIYPLCAAHINDRIVHEDLIQASAALLLVFGVGAAVGPVLGGFVMSAFGPWAVFMFIAGVACLLCVFGVHRLGQTEAVPDTEQVAFEPVGPAPTSPVLDPRVDPDDIDEAG